MEKLDAHTRAKLRSSQILTSLSQVVSELVQNSLDAGAVNIDVGINCEEWTCWVKDNGCGINKQGLTLLGSGLEEGRYGSSKPYQPNALDSSLSTFGFRGEALASAADLSCLEISSRTAKSRETWSMITKGGKKLFSGPAIRWRRESPGTVVCIRDAFYNLPVRRRSHPTPARTLEFVRQELETFALVFTHVAFTLENTSNSGPSKGYLLRIPKTVSSLASFRNLYGRALAEHVEIIDVQSDRLKLDGFISLNGAHSRNYQFLYVNRHPIARCDLHHTIDSAFASSSFGKNALNEIGLTDLPRSTVRRSPRKMERKPVYVLNLTIPYEEVDNCLEPSKAYVQFKQKNAVTELLSSTISSFLNLHGFLTPHETKTRPAASIRSSPFRKKRRKLSFNDDSGFAETTSNNEQSPPEAEPCAEVFQAEVQPPVVNNGASGASETIWTDPQTGQRFAVDLRTGNSYAQSTNDHSSSIHQWRRRTIPCCKDVTSTEPTDSEAPDWLMQALQANNTYDIPENLIPRIKHSLQPLPDLDTWSKQFRPNLTLDSHQLHFEKHDLRRAKVIDQVDKKFIACLIDGHQDNGAEDLSDSRKYSRGSEGPVLVLIDQHAADERVRVEHFLKDLCEGFLRNRENVKGENQIKLRRLSPLRPLLLTVHEARKLKESAEIRQAFQHWGFEFVFTDEPSELTSGIDSSSYAQVLVESIPDIVGDKLLLGDELVELVKGFLGQLEVEAYQNSSLISLEKNKSATELSWLKALRWCPRELLDLVNSKACRGAIMFNDSLSLPQCEDLVRRLAETAFPFQCAHGRPSLVPLTSVGSLFRRDKVTSWQWSRLAE